VVELGGLREMPKYCAILLTDAFRRRVLQAAQTLVEAGRLDDVRQVFDLTMADLDQALADPKLDLRALAEKNTRFLRKLDRVREFPRLIDSRGKILRLPASQRRKGSWSESRSRPASRAGLSRCSARRTKSRYGRVKSWSPRPPIPVDAAVSQCQRGHPRVGGLLQHGALVAREYGKPCVAGIENVTGLLQDGQTVELDGSSGVVRLT